VVPELVEGLEESLTPLMDDIYPTVEVNQKAFEVFQLRQTFLVLLDKPFCSW
jgi:hypothetical protein